MVPHRAVMIALLICAEVLAVTFVYQFVVTLDCQATDAHGACRLLRSMVARAMVVFAALVLLVWARPGPFGRFVAEARSGAGRAPWLGLHLLGLVLLALPVVVGQGRDLSGFFGLALLPWMLGGLAAAVGGVLWLAPARAWAGMLAQDRAVTLVVLAVAVLVPDLAEVLVPLWDWRVMTALTLAAVQAVLSMFGPVQIDPANAVIGIHGFAVHIARQCSGVEGIALVTAFAALYALVFRRDIRLRRYMLVVLPLAILFSWALNVVRIAVLILVGAYLSPEVAVNSFHSYAGWLFFTLVAMSMVWAVQMTPWLHRTARPGPEHRLRDDPDAALILPFVVFMLAGVLAGAFFPHPDLGYPLKVILLAVAVLVFVRVYWRMVWRPDAVTVLAGLAVGVGWLLLDRVAPDADLSAILSQMPESDRIAWAAFRIAGTVLLVPLIEEMFFRGYLLARLDRGGPGWRLVAIAVSSVLFAGLHGRWFLAGAAGVVFALVMLRRGRVTDAVVAHVLANLVIAAGAVALGNWGRI